MLDSALENKPAAAAGDYYTSADLAKSKGGEEKKRKKKERKLRSKPTAAEGDWQGDWVLSVWMCSRLGRRGKELQRKLTVATEGYLLCSV